MNGVLVLFYFMVWICTTVTALGLIESFVTNIIDSTKMNRIQVVVGLCLVGLAISSIFCSNVGWAVFDMVEHYVANYIVILVGLWQCIAVGWVFEWESTAIRSEGHRKALKYLTGFFWVPVHILSFYANFSFGDGKYIAFIFMFVFTIIACFVSFKVSEMSFASWYYEIFMCGVLKLSMSITDMSDMTKRKWWMPLFESYFALTIKFLNPAFLTFMIYEIF